MVKGCGCITIDLKIDLTYSIDYIQVPRSLALKNRKPSPNCKELDNMDRQHISSGSKWEEICGYSRAIRVGNIVEVSGTVAVDGDKVIGEGDIGHQTKFILEKIRKALEAAGSSLKDVIRTRIYVTDIGKWEIVSRVHGEVFRDILPVCTLIQVSALVDPNLLVEIEASAIIE